MDDLKLPEPGEILLGQLRVLLTEVRELKPLLDLMETSQDPQHLQAQENLGLVLRRIHDLVQTMSATQEGVRKDVAEIGRKLDILCAALKLPAT